MKMIKGIENKLKSKAKSKILVLGLIIVVIALLGLFRPAGKANAQVICNADNSNAPCVPEFCFDNNGNLYRSGISEDNCYRAGYSWRTVAQNQEIWGTGTTGPAIGTGVVPGATAPPETSPYGTAVALPENSCGLLWGSDGSFQGCVLQFFYWTLYTLGGWLLAIAASFFNFFIRITLGSEFLKSDFVDLAWGVVRDLSNLFFILILLYIAIKVILNIGGSDAKKMIVWVIIMALLINFSMLMTHVVIDSSNILALIFYNKVNTVDKNAPNPNLAASLIDSATGEKDLAGGLTQSFNPVYKLDAKFFEQAGEIKIPGKPAVPGPVSTATLIGITVIAGAIMLFAAYALFISALSFLGRLIELFVIIIFSPFAFMSFTLPVFKKVEYLGWDSWLSRLLKTAFMAPIFMFFLYFIFLLLGAPMFTDSLKKGTGTVHTLLSLIVPALVVLILLIKATSFAKKGSGSVGEAIIKGGTAVAGIAGGLALGAATGGAALALRGTAGRAGAALANSEWAKKREIEGKFGSGVFRSGAKAIGSGSFDVRGVKIAGKTLSGVTGLNVGEAQKGGFAQAKKNQVEKRANRAKELQVGETEKLKQDLNKTEMDLQGLLGANTQAIEGLDKLIEKKRQEANDAEQQSRIHGAGITNTRTGNTYGVDAANATAELNIAKDNKKKLRTGQAFTDHNGRAQTAITGVGGNIDQLETLQKDQFQAIKTENVKRNQQYAATQQTDFERAKGFILSGGAYTKAASEEAAHKIIMETKLDSGTKT